jgi:multidrug efflux pump subunit AcrB
MKAIQSNDANEHVMAFSGMDFIGGGFKNSAATIFVSQKHWNERSMTTQQLVGEVFGKTAGIKEALVLAFNPPAIFGLGNTGGFEFYLQNRGDGGTKRLVENMGALIGASHQSTVLAGLQTLWRPNAPQLYVDVDRERAKALGVPLNDAFNTLAGTLGTFYVNDFNKFGRVWQVLMSAESQYRRIAGRHRPPVREEHGRRHGAGVGLREGRIQLGSRHGEPLQQPAGREG